MAREGTYLHVISGADASLVGLNIGGWAIKGAYAQPKCKDEYITQEGTLFGYFDKRLGWRMLNGAYRQDGDNPFYIYLKKEADDNPHDVIPVLNALRAYKNSRIGIYNLLSLNEHGNGGIDCILDQYISAPYQGDFSTLSLDEDEKKDIVLFFNNTARSLPGYIENMLTLFHESFRIDSSVARFIMRITILEMLIEANAELSYRLSRSIAVLLGKTVEESEEVFNQCRMLYNARSKYLHNGDRSQITSQRLLLALEYSRRMIANLMVINEEISHVRRCLDRGGYGSNPFNVKL